MGLARALAWQCKDFLILRIQLGWFNREKTLTWAISAKFNHSQNCNVNFRAWPSSHVDANIHHYPSSARFSVHPRPKSASPVTSATHSFMHHRENVSAPPVAWSFPIGFPPPSPSFPYPRTQFMASPSPWSLLSISRIVGPSRCPLPSFLCIITLAVLYVFMRRAGLGSCSLFLRVSMYLSFVAGTSSFPPVSTELPALVLRSSPFNFGVSNPTCIPFRYF